MKIGFLSPWRVDDPEAWSGVVKPMYDALAARADVVPLWSGEIADGAVDRAYLKALGTRFGTYLPGHALHTSWRHGRIMTCRVDACGVDAILAVAASQDVAFLAGDKPVVQVSDTTFAAIRDFYPLYSQLSPVLVPQANLVSRRSAARVRATLAATAWAKEALIRDDRLPPESVTVAPFGPAIAPPSTADPRRFDPVHPRVLVVASNWVRKGGPEALEAFHQLRMDLPGAKLTLVGDSPGNLSEAVTAIGRVPREEMAQIYASHDILLELARSNTAGVTLTDAAGFGLPVVTTSTGGVSSIVAHGRSGLLLPPGPDVSRPAAALLHQICTTTGMWERLSSGAEDRARTVLNWDKWSTKALSVLYSGIGGHGG